MHVKYRVILTRLEAHTALAVKSHSYAVEALKWGVKMTGCLSCICPRNFMLDFAIARLAFGILLYPIQEL